MIRAMGWVAAMMLAAIAAKIVLQWYLEFTASPIRWPRTMRGWRNLCWLFLGRCPIHHEALGSDPWSSGDSLYGFCCDGVSMWPANIVVALQANARVAKRTALHSKGD